MMKRHSQTFAVLTLSASALTLSACAMEQGDFPSLAKRPFEKQTEAQVPPEPVATPLPVDPLTVEQRQRVNAALELSKSAAAAFTALLPETESAIARSGASGTENWAVAQRALSRLEASRTGSVAALADLDKVMIERSDMEEGGAVTGGADAIDAARLPVVTAVEQQRATLDRLSAKLAN